MLKYKSNSLTQFIGMVKHGKLEEHKKPIINGLALLVIQGKLRIYPSGYLGGGLFVCLSKLLIINLSRLWKKYVIRCVDYSVRK